MDKFKALKVYDSDGKIWNQVESMGLEDLDDGDVLIKSAFSSVNYKDALGATGAGRILKKFPLVAGIDVSGTVVTSSHPAFKEGDQVLVTGCGLGESHHGGYSEFVRVPGAWVVPLPETLSLKEAMILGTAGFTAGLCIQRLEQNGQQPDKGPIVVTGASGGVGSLGVSMLAAKGYEVIAVSEKPEQYPRLKAIGASTVTNIEGLALGSKALEAARFGGAIDNVGGAVLEGLLRHTKLWGSIASVGLAMDFKFSNTVMPFILRGVSLLGISSTNCPYDLRCQVWKSLSTQLKPKNLDSFVTGECGLEGLQEVFTQMLGRKTNGRHIVKM